MRLPRTAVLLALACAGGAAILGASEFMTTFEFTPPGGEALDVPQQVTENADRHNYAMVVLAVFALVALVMTIYTGSQVASFAVAASGVIALLIFLIGDLPDANRIGTLDDVRDSFIDAKAEPQAGFWLELVGSLLLAICGAALATMPPEELAVGATRDGSRDSREKRRRDRGDDGGDSGSGSAKDADEPFEWSDPGTRAGP